MHFKFSNEFLADKQTVDKERVNDFIDIYIDLLGWPRNGN